jgi:exopolysaccharide biosynthesis polyprenyl glycosylphosphotransferase
MPPQASWQHQLKRHIYAIALPFVIASDVAIIATAFLGCYAARFWWGWYAPAPAPDLGPYLHGSVLVAIVWTAAMALLGLYKEKRGASRFDDAVIMAAGVTLGALVTLSLSFFYRSFSYSRLVYTSAFIASIGSLGLWHVLLRHAQGRAMSRGWGALNTLILGCNGLSALVAGRLAARPNLGHAIKGVVALPGDDPATAQPVPVLGADTDLPSLLAAHEIDEVIVAWPQSSHQELFGLVQAVTLMRPVSVQMAPAMQEFMTAHLEVTSLDGLPMLAVREVSLRKWQNRVVKRLMDVGLSAVGLFAISPLLAAIALSVKLSSPGPVFYAQERLGRDGRTFTIYKFRSMPLNAEAAGPMWTARDDERATPLGAYLRRYSLDELPQLWNVLKGDMSLVGPRPERPFFVEQFRERVPKYMDRHLVRSGLTGWAQVNGLRGDVSIEERTRYDIYYVENWSVLLDLRILLKTVVEIFRRPGY